MKRAIAPYLIAVASSAVAFWVAHRLQHPWAALSPFFVFYAAVAVSSWRGGTGPGLLATLIGATAADYYLLDPKGSLWVDAPQDVGRLTLFILVGVLISTLYGALRRARTRLELERNAARRSEARAKRLAEANLIGVYFSELNGQVRWANREFLRLLGRSEPDMKAGKVNWRDATAPEHVERDAHAIQELLEKRICTSFEKDHLLSGDERVPVVVGCAMMDEDDEVVGFVLDLTERKRAEAEIQGHRSRLQSMASDLMMAEERERRRIASVLHDGVVQLLALAKLKVDQLRRDTRSELHRPLAGVCELIESSISRTRTLTADLSPPVLYELGLPSAIQWLGDRMRDDYGIEVELSTPEHWEPLNDRARVVLFQAARELLINVTKHAHTDRCEVDLSRDAKGVQLIVRDDGKGFSPTTSINYGNGGLGLFSMRERMEHLGGSFCLQSRPGEGTTVSLGLPLHTAAKKGMDHGHEDTVSGRSPAHASGAALDAR